jgi:hypothetical protein
MNIGKTKTIRQIENEIVAQAEAEGKGVTVRYEGLTQFMVDTEYFETECKRRGIR